MDPYYAVVTHDIFRKNRLSAEALAEFFHGGELHVAEMWGTIEKHIRPGFSPASALDFGCGTGRIVIPMAAHCHVTGVDVSPAMLREAERNAAAHGITNVRFTDTIDDGPYDLVHSYIVFQHIPVKRGLALTGRLFDVLSKEGIAVLHYVYATDANVVMRMIGRGVRRLPFVHGAINVVRGRPFFDPPMEMNPYPLNRLFALFQARGFVSALIRHTNHNGSVGVTFYLWR